MVLKMRSSGDAKEPDAQNKERARRPKEGRERMSDRLDFRNSSAGQRRWKLELPQHASDQTVERDRFVQIVELAGLNAGDI
jgi:hypothetical protein